MIYCNLCRVCFLFENPSHSPEQDHSPARRQPTLAFLKHWCQWYMRLYERYDSLDASMSWEAVYRKGIPPAASWPHPIFVRIIRLRQTQNTDVIRPGPVQMSPVKNPVPSIAARPKQLPSPKPLWLSWGMIDLCTRKSSKKQDDTSQYKCSASEPTGSHWIVIGMKLPGLTGALPQSFPSQHGIFHPVFGRNHPDTHITEYERWLCTKRNIRDREVGVWKNNSAKRGY